MHLIRRTMACAAPLAVTLLLAGTLVAGGCSREPAASSVAGTAGTPVDAVNQLINDLHADDLVGYAAHALPPGLHKQVAIAWSEGRTTWPLSELPLSDQLPGFITTLAAPDAEKTLLASFRGQFAGADRELKAAASTLGLFAAQYVQQSDEYGEEEREHYVQMIAALSAWGAKAPLSDPARAKSALPQLVAAARLTGLGRAGALQQTGMERSLARLGPFMTRFKSVLAGYGLDIDETLSGAQVRLLEQTGDSARVALTYTLSGRSVDAQVRLERRDGRWYPSDLIRHAQAEVAGEHPADTPGASPGPAKLPKR